MRVSHRRDGDRLNPERPTQRRAGARTRCMKRTDLTHCVIQIHTALLSIVMMPVNLAIGTQVMGMKTTNRSQSHQ